jgi:hypothetical protein
VSRRRTTFGKLQRDRDKQAKQQAKVERRQQRSQGGDEGGDEAEASPSAPVDQARILDQLAKLHEAYDDGQLDLDAFEARRAELTSLLHVD